MPEKILAKQSNLEFLRGYFSPLSPKKISAKSLGQKKPDQNSSFQSYFFCLNHLAEIFWGLKDENTPLKTPNQTDWPRNFLPCDHDKRDLYLYLSPVCHLKLQLPLIPEQCHPRQKSACQYPTNGRVSFFLHKYFLTAAQLCLAPWLFYVCNGFIQKQHQ